MSTTADDILAAAIALPRDQRAQIAQRLLETLNPEQAEVDEAWRQEIAARVRAYEAGEIDALPYEDVMSELRHDLANGRLK